MSNIQYFHKRKYIPNQKLSGVSYSLNAKGGCTIAVDLTDLGKKLQESRSGEEIILGAGLAKCSDKDNFNKEIGRSISKGRIKQRKFTIVDIVATVGSKTLLRLENGGLFFDFTIVGDSFRFVSVSE